MEQRQLGDSGLYTSALGFGTWEMSTTMYGHIDIKEASDAVGAAGHQHGAELVFADQVLGGPRLPRSLGHGIEHGRAHTGDGAQQKQQAPVQLGDLDAQPVAFAGTGQGRRGHCGSGR